jgi:DNA-binding YbaB/EbfC family protein
MNPSNLGDLVKHASRMRKDMDRVQEDLKNRYVETRAGGDLVEVTANCQQQIVKITINPKFFGGAKVDIEMLEDLIVAAVSQAVEKSKNVMKEEIEKVTGGLSGLIPGLF